MAREPIEIAMSDLIERPAEVVGGVGVPAPVTKDPGLFGQVKEIFSLMKDLKEMNKQLKDMGIDLSAMMPGMGGQQPPGGGDPQGGSPGPSPMDQMRGVLAALRMKYGDCTVNELLEKLRQEYGNKKLSSF